MPLLLQTLFKSGDVDMSFLNETFLYEKEFLNNIQSFDVAAGGLQIVIPVDQTAPHYSVDIIDSFHLLTSVFYE